MYLQFNNNNCDYILFVYTFMLMKKLKYDNSYYHKIDHLLINIIDD